MVVIFSRASIGYLYYAKLSSAYLVNFTSSNMYFNNFIIRFSIHVICTLSVWAESYLFTHQPITTQFLKPRENVNGYGMDSSLGVLALTFLISISPYVHKLFIDVSFFNKFYLHFSTHFKWN